MADNGRIGALADFFSGDDGQISPPITEADNALIAKALRLLASYDQRVAELLAANTAEFERRREAEARLGEMVRLYNERNPGPAYVQVLGWAVVTFGSVASEQHERALRFVEEAVEVGHAAGLSAEEGACIVDRVYSRPVGALAVEIAQAGLCLGTLSTVVGVDVRAAEAAEFDRIQAIPKIEWQLRHAAKVHSGIADVAEAPDA